MARLACESVMARNSHDPATVPEGPWLRFWVPGKLGFHCLRLTAVCKMWPQALGGAVFAFPFSPSLMSKSSSLSRQNKWFRDRNASFMFCFRFHNLRTFYCFIFVFPMLYLVQSYQEDLCLCDRLITEVTPSVLSSVYLDDLLFMRLHPQRQFLHLEISLHPSNMSLNHFLLKLSPKHLFSYSSSLF